MGYIVSKDLILASCNAKIRSLLKFLLIQFPISYCVCMIVCSLSVSHIHVPVIWVCDFFLSLICLKSLTFHSITLQRNWCKTITSNICLQLATCNESEITSGFRQLVQTIMTYICALMELRVEEQTLAKFYRALTHKIYDLLDKVRFNFLEIFPSPISLRICDLLTFVFVFALLTQRFLFILFSNADHAFVGQFKKLCIKWWFLSPVFYRHLRIIYFNLKIIYFNLKLILSFILLLEWYSE